MLKLKKIYQKISKQTQNKLQEKLDTFKFTSENLYNIADNKTKNRINTYIETWKEQGLLKGYFGILTKNIYNRTRVKNSEILELLIYSAYIEEQDKLDKYEQQIMYEDANYYYQQGQQEVNKTLKKKKPISILDIALFLYLMEQPNAKGYIWKQYIESTIKYNAEQIYRQATIDLQQQKELDITDDVYQNIIKRQNNSKLNINDNKISGDIDLTLIGINNKAKIEGIYSFDDKAKVKFCGINDEKQTDMCKSLDNQEFYIHDWNEFERYSKSNDSIKKYRCFGLIIGLNCPPIDDGFHWCRSYLTYLPTVEENSDEEFEIFNNIKSLVTGIRQENIDINDIITKAFNNEKIRKIALNNAVHKVYTYQENKCKHKKGNIYLSKDWHKRSKEKQERTLRHEIGHAVDYKYNYISTKELTEALEKDKVNILKNKQKINNELKEKYYNYTELSDIIGGITRNKVVGYGFHHTEYWNEKGKLEKETFANLFSIAGSNNIEYLKVIDNYLPNTLKKFDKIIRELI